MPKPFEIKRAPASYPGTCCDAESCQAVAAYKAPRARGEKGFYWFCLEHIRLYNAAWDYFDGFAPAQIEKQLKYDFVWERPSWPFGSVSTASSQPHTAPAEEVIAPKYKKAMGVLGLTPPVTTEKVKGRYRDLVKRFHPDTNNGSRANEERLKTIVEAYKTLDEWLERAA